MNTEWLEQNKAMQSLIKKQATFNDGITILLDLRRKLMDEVYS